MLEVEPTSHRGRMTTGNGQNGNEAVADAASEAFARWLQCTVDMPSPSNCHRVIPCLRGKSLFDFRTVHRYDE